jgi:glycosyltransferase involved in cell wall biosynthesis
MSLSLGISQQCREVVPAARDKRAAVSIVLTTFNRSELLRDAIEGVIKQTFDAWELIIWDDGSTDQTEKVVREYKDDRIRYYRDVNRGLPGARNQGIARATGDYIALTDDDDIWAPGKLERQIQTMRAHPEIDVLFSNFENLDLSSQKRTSSFASKADVFAQLSTEDLGSGTHLIKKGLLENLIHRNIILPSTTMVRNTVFERVGKFQEELKAMEDVEFWWRCGLRGIRFAYFDEAMVLRRVGQGNITRNRVPGLTWLFKASGYCQDQALAAGHAALAQVAKRGMGLCWENLIRIHGEEGRPKEAVRAFRRRCDFGVTARAMVLVVCAVFGSWTFRYFGKRRGVARP